MLKRGARLADSVGMEDTARLLDVIRLQGEIEWAALDTGAVMALVVRRARQMTRAHGGVVELRDGDQMVYRAVSGTAAPFEGLSVSLDGSLSGLCAQTGEVLRSDDTSEDPRVDGAACARVGARSLLCVPLMHGEEGIGVLKVYADRPRAFAPDDERSLDLLSGLLAAQLSHAAAFAHGVEESRCDVLTGLGNRRAYEKRLAGEVERCARYGTPVSLVLLDLDGFKRVNDGGGHSAGDHVLRRVGAVLAGECRPSDAAFRFGGDEFAVLLPGASAADAEHAAARIAQRIARGHLGVSASTGVATAQSADPPTLHDRADAALHAAKRQRWDDLTSAGTP